jgi:hypothetical protein
MNAAVSTQPATISTTVTQYTRAPSAESRQGAASVPLRGIDGPCVALTQVDDRDHHIGGVDERSVARIVLGVLRHKSLLGSVGSITSDWPAHRKNSPAAIKKVAKIASARAD